MLPKEQIEAMLYATLNELQIREADKSLEGKLKVRLVTKLDVLSDILHDDIPEDYWEQIDKYLEADI